jgi:hypothetical protein
VGGREGLYDQLVRVVVLRISILLLAKAFGEGTCGIVMTRKRGRMYYST